MQFGLAEAGFAAFVAVGAYKADCFAELNRWAGDCALRSTQKVSSTVDALAALANRQRSASRTGRVAGDACQRQSICEFAALTLRSALIDFDLQVKLLRTIRGAFCAFSEARSGAGLAPESTLEASTKSSICVVSIWTRSETAIVQEEVILCTAQRSAIFSQDTAGNTGTTARLALIWHQSGYKFSSRTGKTTNIQPNVFIIFQPTVIFTLST